MQERLLGQGGMGAVYLVRDRGTGEQLALKKPFHVDARSVLRLKREFRSVADMSHPNLVKVYELGHTRDGLFLTMEYVPGQDLQTYLGRDDDGELHSRIDAALVQITSERTWLHDVLMPVFRPLASGVHALHQSGVLHRDLKPSNVLVADRRVVVLDLGLARELSPSKPALTEDGAISGTPAYMAPEQALGKPLSEASDWYAFGTMLYAESSLALAAAILWERVLLFLRGSRLRMRKENEIAPALLLKIDACNAFRTELASIDPIRTAWFMLRSLRWSLDAGEPQRALNAISGLYYVLSQRRSRRAMRRSERLMRQMQRFSESLGTPAERALVTSIETISLWMRGRPDAVIAPSREAERLCREELTDRAGQRPLQRVRRKTLQALRELSTGRAGTYKSSQLRLMRARLHWLDGDEPRAIELLRALLASPRFYGTENARYALGRLLGGSEGMLLCSEAEAKLREQGVVNPVRVLTTMYPEFTEIGRP